MPPDASANRQAIADIQNAFRAAIDQETIVASNHISDSYYTSSRGRNVGRDEMMAVVFAKKLALTPSVTEVADPLQYAKRLIADLEVIKSDYRASEDDPDGFGIGTLHGISRALEPFIKGAG